MELIPFEILCVIASLLLSVRDLVRFGQCSKRLLRVTKMRAVWIQVIKSDVRLGFEMKIQENENAMAYYNRRLKMVPGKRRLIVFQDTCELLRSQYSIYKTDGDKVHSSMIEQKLLSEIGNMVYVSETTGKCLPKDSIKKIQVSIETQEVVVTLQLKKNHGLLERRVKFQQVESAFEKHQ
jgi:hypothetical protein